MWLIIIFSEILYLAVILCRGDESVYRDTNAVTNIHDNIDISSPSSAILNLRTSNAYLAGTTDLIYATFIGDFSLSGPHNIGFFLQGGYSEVKVQLSRDIGNLKEIIFYNYGNDGWLPSVVTCQLDGKLYSMTGPRQWLDSFSSPLQDSTGDGFEPYDQERISAAPELRMTIAETIQLFSTTNSLSFDV
jgi:hypothetical protein